MTDGNQPKSKRSPDVQRALHERRDRAFFRWRNQREAKDAAKVARLRAQRLEHEAIHGVIEPLETEVDERVPRPKNKQPK